MKISRLIATIAVVLAFGPPASAQEAVTALVENKSEPTQCAEFDNVYYTLSGPRVRRFELDVTAPVYLADLKEDNTGPDFTHCEAMKDDPKNKFTPKQVVLHDDGHIRIVGHTYAESWRAKGAEVVVGKTAESDLHLVQLFQKIDGQFVEYLVVYPFDGYWRAKPVPTEKFPNAAYGTSFLIGPIETQHRPIVDISRLEIDPEGRSFRMSFARGGTGTLRVRTADRERVTLDVSLSDLPETEPATPFSAIRSMFVTPTNADTARVNWRTPDGLFNEPVMDFKSAATSEVRFDRIELSKHNTSAPDVTFRAFAGASAPR